MPFVCLCEKFAVQSLRRMSSCRKNRLASIPRRPRSCPSRGSAEQAQTRLNSASPPRREGEGPVSDCKESSPYSHYSPRRCVCDLPNAKPKEVKGTYRLCLRLIRRAKDRCRIAFWWPSVRSTEERWDQNGESYSSSTETAAVPGLKSAPALQPSVGRFSLVVALARAERSRHRAITFRIYNDAMA
jgi:hypothetical protein